MASGVSGEDTLPTIRKLDQATVNRIAAGEVIHRPANALKELLENSIDAGSTNISVMAKSGGLKLLQVTDNGHGIKKEDLGIAVERFTTSKLQTYEDLTSINTFGFRGEALASMSHVAHLSITTMTAGSPCAYKAHYCDSCMVPAKEGESAEPRACAGVKGTVITIEDLFYNVPSRRKALKNPSDEYQKIVEVVSRYALRFSQVGFTCKRAGENTADVRTRPNSKTIDNIRNIHGQQVARELLEVQGESPALKVKVDGFVSNANYSVKRMVLVLFINDRLVECAPIKRCLESIYANMLPKGSHPFVYLSLSFPPSKLDVNVHPTKQEVRFLDEEQVIDFVQETVEDKLLGANASRTFYTQTLLPSAPAPDDPASAARDTPEGDPGDSSLPKSRAPQPNPSRLVRTTAATEAGQMEAFLMRLPPTTDRSQSRVSSKRARGDPAGGIVLATDHRRRTQSLNIGTWGEDEQDEQQAAASSSARGASQGEGGEGGGGGEVEAGLPRTVRKRARQRQQTSLSSVQKLLGRVEARAHEGLVELVREHVFVGCASEMLALVQHGTKLFLLDLPPLTREAAYQACLRRFGDLDRIELRPPAPVRALVRATLDSEEAGWSEEDGDKAEIADYVTNLLVHEKGEMLRVYFALHFDAETESLTAVPELLDNLLPPLPLLGMFLLRLAIQADWDSEEGCFATVSQELASWYMVRPSFTSAVLPEDLRGHIRSQRAARPPEASPGGETVEREKEEEGEGGDGVAIGGGHKVGGDRAHSQEEPTEQGPVGEEGRRGGRGDDVVVGGGAGESSKEAENGADASTAEKGEGRERGLGGEAAREAGNNDAVAGRIGGGKSEWQWTVQHVIFPAIRFLLQPPRTFSTDGTVVQLVCTSQLYRVFERC